MFYLSPLLGDGTIVSPKRPAMATRECRVHDLTAPRCVVETGEQVSDYRFPQVPSAEPTLEECRAAIIAAADLRTQSKIAEGVQWNGETFSLSLQAQSNWTNLFISRQGLTYPLQVSTADDGAYSFANAAEVAAFYGAGIALVKQHLDAGRAIKLAASAAQTFADLDAIDLE